MFVSHAGDIWPAGFLPLTVNVRENRIADVYRNAPVFWRCTIQNSFTAVAERARTRDVRWLACQGV